ncbi:hypothetical protein [Oceanithermus sp.]
MAYEESPEDFWRQFSKYAVAVELLPVPYGYPVVEALTPIGAVYAFDRGAPPTPAGRQEALFAAFVDSFRYRRARPGLHPLQGGRTLISGKVLKKFAEDTYLFDSGLPLILSSGEPLEIGAPIELIAAPPLMLFRDED